MTEISAGTLTAVLDNGELHDVRALGWPVLDACYVTVRDENWRTVGCHVNDVRSRDGVFTIDGVHDDGDDGPIAVRWTATVIARADELLFELDAECLRDFDSNRIGFCMLHPQELRGRTVSGSGPGGEQHGSFGPPIDPLPVLSAVDSMRYAVADGVEVELAMTGDLFEVEDHRNWTDPGWKTYCTPLSQPRPVRRRAGERIHQSVRFTVTRRDTALARPAVADPVPLTVGEAVGRMPSLALGAALDRDASADGPRPAALHVELEALADWQAALDLAADEARALGLPIDAWLVAEPAALPELAGALRGAGCALGRVAAFSPTSHTTQSGTAQTLRAELGPDVLVGGGTRAAMAELNRAGFGEEVDVWDFVTYSISPEVHHRDERSVLATVGALADTVDQARAIAPDLPIVVGPITMRPRFPGESTQPHPMPIGDTDAPDADPRLHGALGATYLAGAACVLADVDHLIAFRTAGRRGLQPRSGVATAVSGVAEQLIRAAGRPVRTVDVGGDPHLHALAIDGARGQQILVVNPGEQSRRVQIGNTPPATIAPRDFAWLTGDE